MIAQQLRELGAEMKQQSQNMQRLEELIAGRGPMTVSYKGGVKGTLIYKAEDFAIQRAFIPAGTTLDGHVHKATEIIVGLSGKCVINMGGLVKEVSPGDVSYIKPNTAHSCSANEDTWVLGILVPCNGGYPDAEK